MIIEYAYGTDKNGKTIVTVKLEKKIVGAIKPVESGFKYFPKGQKTGGEKFETIAQVMNSLAFDE
jgi:hypothetical protein